MQRDEEVRRHRRAGVVERALVVSQIEGGQAERLREPAPPASGVVVFAGHRSPRAVDLLCASRALYHAGASMASYFLVTLHRAATRALAGAGAPPAALEPLMRRTIDNGFDLTGPIQRGDTATVEAHLAALTAALPDLLPLYRALAAATR